MSNYYYKKMKDQFGCEHLIISEVHNRSSSVIAMLDQNQIDSLMREWGVDLDSEEQPKPLLKHRLSEY